MGDFAIGIPWRPGDAHREASHAYVSAELGRLFPGVQILHVDSGHPRFSRAASRNAVMELLEGWRAVMVLDADTVPEPGPVWAAVNAVEDGALHLPYTEFVPLSEADTRAVLGGAPMPALPEGLEPSNSTGGALVMSPRTWWRCGGMDERFTGWGFEDAAFAFAAARLGKGLVRHEGVIRHLWHPEGRDPDDPAHERGLALCERYQDAHTAKAMQELVAEHARLRGEAP